MLWVDEFNLKWLLALPAPPGGQPVAARTGSRFATPAAAPPAARGPADPGDRPRAAAAPPARSSSARPAAAAAPAPSAAPPPAPAAPSTPASPHAAPPPAATAPAPFSHERCVSPDPAARASWAGRAKGERRPRVGASIAVHPPKFYALAKFLDQFAACPAAVASLVVYAVFSSAQDLRLFRDALACLSPDLPADAWEPVVALTPRGGWRTQGSGHQITAAYKKWHGIVHMMDLPAGEAPDYGLMMDAELLLYDGRGEDKRGGDCQPGGAWSGLLERIQRAEASKSFPAARVSATLTAYDFGSWKQTGKMYDQALIRENVYFIGPEVLLCGSTACQEIRNQVERCLFSWWTDLPWMNLTVAGGLLEWASRAQRRPKPELQGWRPTPGWRPSRGWRDLSVGIGFKRFEHMAYQQWCVLQEGFHFRDVTNITGEAKWGSYMEDPLPGARLGELRPLWVSGQALERVEDGRLPPLPGEAPPLLIFHSDQGRSRARREQRKATWEQVLVALLKRHGRGDFNKDSIK